MPPRNARASLYTSPMKLGYCTNVHPYETLAQAWEALREYAVPIKQAASPDAPLGIGLHLPAAAAEPLAERPETAADFRAFLREAGLQPFTFNIFPYGGFHAQRVKEAVYRPDWGTPRRLAYTLQAARAAAALLDEGETATLSTLPLAWKAGYQGGEPGLEAMAESLREAARELERLRSATGRTLLLCLEPEPGCLLETTEDAVAFFRRHLLRGPEEGTARRHLGICFDTCHMALQYEDLPASLARFESEGIRVGKIQLSSALSVKHPGRNPEAVDALRAFDEPRYLHQLTARTDGGEVLRLDDLPLLNVAGAPWDRAAEWRCHFHVPVDKAGYGPLDTTRADLEALLDAVRRLKSPPDLEVETYTWSVLPEGERPAGPAGLVEGIARELAWAKARLGGGRARTSLF